MRTPKTRKTFLGALLALFMALPLALAAAPAAQARPLDFPYTSLECNIVARPTLTGRLNVYVNVDEGERPNSINRLYVQISDNGRIFAAGQVATRLPWNYRDRVPNFGGTDVFVLTVYNRSTGELCSDYYITGLRRGNLRDLVDRPPLIRN